MGSGGCVGDAELLGGRGTGEVPDAVDELGPRARPRTERDPELEGLV